MPEGIAPCRKLDAEQLGPEHLARLRAAAAANHAIPSALHSEQLGCVAVLALGGVVGGLVAAGAIARDGVRWYSVVGLVVAVLAAILAARVLLARKRSPLPEFKLTLHAYYIESYGDGSLRAYCLALHQDVTFRTVLLNNIYNHTLMEVRFGSEQWTLQDTLHGADRDRPAQASPLFCATLQMLKTARNALATGQWKSLPGADLLPGEPVPSQLGPG